MLHFLLDYSILRRLVIRAQYDVSCQLLDDQITMRTLKSLATSHFAQVKTICGPGECAIQSINMY